MTIPLDLERIQALCFDVDGTLSDTDDLWVHKFYQILKPVFHGLPEEKVRAFSRSLIMAAETPANKIYHWLDHLDLDDEAAGLINWFSKLRISNRNPIFWLIPGVGELLQTLAGKYPMAVVSARGENSTLDFLRQHDLLRFFQCVATAQTCRFTKPFPDPIRWAAGQMGVPPANCLMIGDTIVDIISARRAGAQSVGVLCGFGVEKELRQSGANLILPTTAMLGEILNPATG
jgi:phosphoglycolate phosphatase-like HAD superfamily hydrolase